MTFADPTTIVTEEETAAILKETLILLPSYSNPADETTLLLFHLQQLGAEVQQQRGCSDVALARNLLALAVVEIEKKMPGRFRFVFWLDNDMTATPVHIAVLCKLAELSDACVSGIYCRKTTEKEWCFRRVPSDSEVLEGVRLEPAVGGLGCCAITTRAFLHICDSVPAADFGDRKLPAVFQSRLEGRDWLSEDLWFGKCAWESGVGFYAAPIAFGHVATRAIMPAEDGSWMFGETPIRPLEEACPETLRPEQLEDSKLDLGVVFPRPNIPSTIPGVPNFRDPKLEFVTRDQEGVVMSREPL